MKKTAISFLLLSCAIPCACFAQSIGIAENTHPSLPDTVKSLSQSRAMPAGPGAILFNNINIKAARDFMTSYKNPLDVRWTILPDGFRVHFYCDGVQMRIFYDKHGNRQSVMRSYGEDKLPHAIRHLVRSNYYDFSIFNITEVTNGDKVIYFVKMEDKTRWITIKVTDGELEVTEEYPKT